VKYQYHTWKVFKLPLKPFRLHMENLILCFTDGQVHTCIQEKKCIKSREKRKTNCDNTDNNLISSAKWLFVVTWCNMFNYVFIIILIVYTIYSWSDTTIDWKMIQWNIDVDMVNNKKTHACTQNLKLGNIK